MSFSVWKDHLRPASSPGRSALNSGPRWLIMGAAIARCTRSGTGVGPGMRSCGVWAISRIAYRPDCIRLARNALPSGYRATTAIGTPAIRRWLRGSHRSPDGGAHHNPEDHDAADDQAPARGGRGSRRIGCPRRARPMLCCRRGFDVGDLDAGLLDLRIGGEHPLEDAEGDRVAEVALQEQAALARIRQVGGLDGGGRNVRTNPKLRLGHDAVVLDLEAAERLGEAGLDSLREWKAIRLGIEDGGPTDRRVAVEGVDVQADEHAGA